jgi:hypothetical protein
MLPASVSVTSGMIAFQTPLIPAKAGIHSVDSAFAKVCEWIPAFAGMTAAL